MAAISLVFFQSFARISLTRNRRQLKSFIPLFPSSVNYSTAQANEDTSVFEEDEAAKVALQQAKRNKSKLKERHYRQVNGQVPVHIENPVHPYEKTVSYRRKLLAQYGLESTKINPGIAWPTTSELEEAIEFEQVAHPYTLQQMIAIVKERKETEAKKLKDREIEIEQKVKKLDSWMKELKQRQQKKLDEGRIAREKKDAIINEVRRILGPNVTQSDPRYTELLEKMEKEAKKAEKEAKKQAKAEKAITKATQQLVKEAETSGS